jgi:glycerol-3-phosphate dehydrogenase
MLGHPRRAAELACAIASLDGEIAIIGAGVVGCAVAHALARRGVGALLLESQARLGLGASGANSGILHTGFDSEPWALETRMILRSAELREQYMRELGVPFVRCGARLRARDAAGIERVARIAQGTSVNGVKTRMIEEGELLVPGEGMTDPLLLTQALADAAVAGGATLRLGTEVAGLAPASGGGLTIELAGGERLRASAAVNCAGLYGDRFAREIEVYPRKGEFLVFEQAGGAPLKEILLPVPSAMGKGVLVFPTVDGHVIAGPTAREREDKDDWTVEPDAAELILPRAREMYPPLEGAEPIAAYAGLRPAGRDANYAIGLSPDVTGLVNVAAIRSTGLSAAFGIGEHVTRLLERASLVELGADRALASAPRQPSPPWWQLAAERSRGTLSA